MAVPMTSWTRCMLSLPMWDTFVAEVVIPLARGVVT